MRRRVRPRRSGPSSAAAQACPPRRVLAAAVPNSAPSGAAPPRPPPPSPAPRRVLASTRRPPLRAVDSDTATVTSAVPAPTQRPRVHARRTVAALACTLLLSSPEKLDVPPLDATADLAGEGRCSPLVYASSTRSPVPPIPLPCRPPELHLRLFSYFCLAFNPQWAGTSGRRSIFPRDYHRWRPSTCCPFKRHDSWYASSPVLGGRCM